MNQATSEVEDFSDLDSLLETNLADVADLPEYIDEIPSGNYKLLISLCEKKKVEVPDKDNPGKKVKATTIQLNFTTLECIELVDPSKMEKVPKMGGIISESVWFNKDVQQGLSVLKAKFEEIAKAQGIDNMLTLVNSLQGMTVFATIKCKANTKKEGYFFIQVTNCVPA